MVFQSPKSHFQNCHLHTIKGKQQWQRFPLECTFELIYKFKLWFDLKYNAHYYSRAGFVRVSEMTAVLTLDR